MSEALIQKLTKEGYVKGLRKTLERKPGQLIFVNDISAFESALNHSLGSSRIKITDEQANIILTAGQKKAKELQRNFEAYDKEAFNLLKGKILKNNLLHGETLGETAFLVRSFNKSISSIKTEMIKALKSVRTRLTKRQVRALQREVHKGHGEAGEAVSQVNIAEGLEVIGLSDEELIKHLQNAIIQGAVDLEVEESEALGNLFLTYKQIVAGGTIRADYVSRITFQFSKENVGKDSQLEKKIRQAFFNDFIPYLQNQPGGLLNLEGSSSLKQKIGYTLIKGVIPRKAKAKISPEYKKVNTKTSGKVAIALGTKGKSAKKLKTKVSAKKPEVSKRSNISLDKLLPVINQQLPKVVARNMGSPKLNYRTGRFAQSVQAVNTTTTRQGFTSIGYTYMRNPYQVFEYPGGSPRLATPDRDPRKIIEQSIREIATGLINQRFYVRRI